MGKNSEKKIWDRPIEESKIDPVYQGGYTDGYEAGEQYGHISSWNEAIEAAAGYHDEQSEYHREKGSREDLVMSLLHKKYAMAIRKLKKEVPNGG